MTSLRDSLAFGLKSDPTRNALYLPNGAALSYAELSAKVEGYCRVTESLTQENNLIGILSPKSFESVAVLLSILSSGGAYLPLDIGSPPNRIGLILDEARLGFLWVSDQLLGQYTSYLRSWGFKKEVESDGMSLWCRKGSVQVDDSTAYVLFTSGSTGSPKGVEITHKNALTFIDWCIQEFSLCEKDVMTSIAPFHFDLSIFDLLASLKSGASVILFDERSIKNPLLMTTTMVKLGASVIYTTPTVLKLMVRYGKWSRSKYDGLRLILFAGEVYPVDEWSKLHEVWPEVPMYNLYGPTETNVVSYAQVSASDILERREVPMGHFCPFAEWRIEPRESLDNGGVRGRLWVSGASVASGYLNRGDLTKEVFLKDDEEVWYDTGDLVEVDRSGVFLFRGRADRMTKRNGYRIELGEIEAASRSLDGIQQAVAISEHVEDSVRIKLFFQVSEDSESITIEVVRDHLLSKLPAYMIPDDFQQIVEMPMTSNHKVDYIALSKFN